MDSGFFAQCYTPASCLVMTLENVVDETVKSLIGEEFLCSNIREQVSLAATMQLS